MANKIKKYIYDLLNAKVNNRRAHRIYVFVIATLIYLNIFAVLLGTVAELNQSYGSLLRGIARGTLLVFVFEYCIRLWICTENKKYAHPIRGRLRYIVTPLALIDLLVIIPFFSGVSYHQFLMHFRVFRVFALLTILKSSRFSSSLRMILRVFGSKKSELLISLVITFNLLIILSTAMFLLEHDAQPKVFSSALEGMWWGITTLTTVGYGDMVPITPWGKVLGALSQLAAISLFVLPTAVITSAFNREMKRQEIHQFCGHCGKQLPQQ